MLYILVLVCAAGQPCDRTTARAFAAYQAPPGIIVCGPPGMLPLQNSALSPQDGEEQHVRCGLIPPSP